MKRLVQLEYLVDHALQKLRQTQDDVDNKYIDIKVKDKEIDVLRNKYCLLNTALRDISLYNSTILHYDEHQQTAFL